MADPKTTKIVMGADNLGVDLKNAVKDHLVGKGWTSRISASNTPIRLTIPISR